jgi:hypothetical protein
MNVPRIPRRKGPRPRHLAWLLLALAPAAMACGVFGVADQVSGDGQSITSRKLIALQQQAIRHGGYDQAIHDMQQIRDGFLARERLSPGVRRRLALDLTRNIDQLRCWSATCTQRTGEPDCPF